MAYGIIEELRRWLWSDADEDRVKTGELRDVEEPQRPASAAAGNVGAAKAVGSEPLCFVVDDEKGIRQAILLVLRGLGVGAEEFQDVPSMLQGLQRQTPDLIFLDLSLGNSDAVEAIQGLERQGFRGTVQLMSGQDALLLEGIKRIGERRSLRMLPVLEKPFRADTIRRIVQEQGLVRGTAPTPKFGLDEALRRDWLELWYQPKFDLRAQRLAGAEALIRTRHPEQGLLLPEKFLLGASEESLLALTEHVLLTALRDWPAFANAGNPLPLAVDVPVCALTKLPLAALIRENRPKSPAWPGLILEITEEQIVKDIPLAHEIATQLRLYKVALAIDDFGAGYSSLARLRELPFAELKLDGSFVANCATDSINAGICKATIDLAHSFGSLAVAEAIETATDLQALHRMGCDLGQGSLLAAPMPKEQLVTLLRQPARKDDKSYIIKQNPLVSTGGEGPSAAPEGRQA